MATFPKNFIVLMIAASALFTIISLGTSFWMQVQGINVDRHVQPKKLTDTIQ